MLSNRTRGRVKKSEHSVESSRGVGQKMYSTLSIGEQTTLIGDIRIRKGFYNCPESSHGQGVYFGRKVNTFNIDKTLSTDRPRLPSSAPSFKIKDYMMI